MCVNSQHKLLKTYWHFYKLNLNYSKFPLLLDPCLSGRVVPSPAQPLQTILAPAPPCVNTSHAEYRSDHWRLAIDYGHFYHEVDRWSAKLTDDYLRCQFTDHHFVNECKNIKNINHPSTISKMASSAQIILYNPNQTTTSKDKIFNSEFLSFNNAKIWTNSWINFNIFPPLETNHLK